jgi:ribonuclease H2 subunit C
LVRSCPYLANTFSKTRLSGVAAQATERLLPQQSRKLNDEPGPDESAASDEDDDPDDKPEPVKILQSTATFSKITVWGHDMLPAADDPFVKGVEEWIAFAEAIHVQPSTRESHTAKAASTQAGS